MTAMAGSFLFINSPGMLVPSEAFFIYAISTLTTEPLMEVIKCSEAIGSWSAHMERVYHFLSADEMRRFNSSRQNSYFRPVVSHDDQTIPSEDAMNNLAIMFSHVTMWRAETGTLVLNDATFSIQRSKIVMIIGPVGCGKSTICRLILGETNAQHGLIRRQSGPVALCSQTPWIWDGSVRDNILGENIYDQRWYSSVVEACFLNDGMKLLPNKDVSRVGSHGSNLSRTHQIQVVSDPGYCQETILLANYSGSCASRVLSRSSNRLG